MDAAALSFVSEKTDARGTLLPRSIIGAGRVFRQFAHALFLSQHSAGVLLASGCTVRDHYRNM